MHCKIILTKVAGAYFSDVALAFGVKQPVPLHSGLPPQLPPPSSGSASAAAAGYYGHHAPPPPPSSSSSGDPNSPVNKYHGLSLAAAAAAHENGHGGGHSGGATNHSTHVGAAHDSFSDYSHFVDLHGHHHAAAAAAAAGVHAHHPGPGRSPYSVYATSPPTSMPPAHISRPLTVLRSNGKITSRPNAC